MYLFLVIHYNLSLINLFSLALNLTTQWRIFFVLGTGSSQTLVLCEIIEKNFVVFRNAIMLPINLFICVCLLFGEIRLLKMQKQKCVKMKQVRCPCHQGVLCYITLLNICKYMTIKDYIFCTIWFIFIAKNFTNKIEIAVQSLTLS